MQLRPWKHSHRKFPCVRFMPIIQQWYNLSIFHCIFKWLSPHCASGNPILIRKLQTYFRRKRNKKKVFALFIFVSPSLLSNTEPIFTSHVGSIAKTISTQSNDNIITPNIRFTLLIITISFLSKFILQKYKNILNSFAQFKIML